MKLKTTLRHALNMLNAIHSTDAAILKMDSVSARFMFWIKRTRSVLEIEQRAYQETCKELDGYEAFQGDLEKLKATHTKNGLQGPIPTAEFNALVDQHSKANEAATEVLDLEIPLVLPDIEDDVWPDCGAVYPILLILEDMRAGSTATPIKADKEAA